MENFSSEVKAMGAIDAALSDLDDAARVRVIQWAIEKFGLVISPSTSSIKARVEGDNQNEIEAGFNVFEYEEEDVDGNRSKRVKATFTDETAKNIGQPLARAIGGRAPIYKEMRENESELLIEGDNELGDFSSSPDEKEDVEEAKFVDEHFEYDDQKRMREVFRYKGEVLELDSPHIKATSKIDYVRRLTRLFLYANWLEGRKEIKREALNQIWCDRSIDGPNSITWLHKTDGIEVQDEILIINRIGRQRAKEALNDIFDSEKKDEWTSESDNRKSTTKKSDKKEASRSKSRQKLSSGEIKEWADQWKKGNDKAKVHRLSTWTYLVLITA